MRLLLEDMEHKDSVVETHRVNSSVCISAPVFNHLKHTCRTEAPQWFRVSVLTAGLRKVERIAECPLDRSRHPIQIRSGASEPHERFERHDNYASMGIFSNMRRMPRTLKVRA